MLAIDFIHTFTQQRIGHWNNNIIALRLNMEIFIPGYGSSQILYCRQKVVGTIN